MWWRLQPYVSQVINDLVGAYNSIDKVDKMVLPFPYAQLLKVRVRVRVRLGLGLVSSTAALAGAGAAAGAGMVTGATDREPELPGMRGSWREESRARSEAGPTCAPRPAITAGAPG